MNRAFWGALLLGFILAPGGCKAKTDEKAAIREGVIKHIAGMNGLNVNNMTITVTKSTIDGDKAQADVDIRAKMADPTAPAMQLTYEMQKQGNEWVVLKGRATGGMQHPAAGALPPGHPSTNGASGQMPADHPDFNAIMNSAQPPAQPQQPSSGQQPTQQLPTNSKP
jgi:hypothetical protein